MSSRAEILAPIVTIAVVLLFSPSIARSQAIGADTRSERHEIASIILHETRTFRIHLPDGYERSGERYTVFYKLDGEWNLPAFAFILDQLADEGRIPRMILVAIENSDRHRDMTPTRISGHAKTGEADYFIDFIRRELTPFIDAEYRTTGERILFGHSLAGLFTIYAFVSAGDLADRYIATSPSIHHDLKKLLFLAQESFERQSCAGRALYFATGTDDVEGYLDAARSLAAYFDAAASADLKWKFEPLEGENHSTAPFVALRRALLFLYPKVSDDAR